MHFHVRSRDIHIIYQQISTLRALHPVLPLQKVQEVQGSKLTFLVTRQLATDPKILVARS